MAWVDVAYLKNNVKIVKEEGFYEKYTPKETLGYGMTSVVRKCVNNTNFNEYAVKIIEKNPTKEPEVRAEIYALSQLSDDPNIIGLVDVFENETHFFLVFELADGGELFDYLTKSITIPERQACDMMHQLLSVVAHMHRLNICHRDLKPENILLNNKGRLLVSDFGFAIQIKPGKSLTDLCGTPDYLSPEILRCSIDSVATGYGLKVDLWSCGVIAYMLLSGSSPFWHRKQNVMLWNIMDGKYSLEGPEWENISELSKKLISSLLVVDPDERMSAETALLHPWFEQLRLERPPYPKPRLSFKTLVSAIMVLSELHALCLSQKIPETVEVVAKNPYAQATVRKLIDSCAFSIYGHWVKRSNIWRQNRAAIYENKPKSDLCDEERCLLTKPYQYKLSYTYPTGRVPS